MAKKGAIKIPLLVDLGSTLKQLAGFDTALEETRKAADATADATGRVGDEAEEAAKEAKTALNSIGLKTKEQVEGQVAFHKQNMAKIVSVYGEGSAEAEHYWKRASQKIERVQRQAAQKTETVWGRAVRNIDRKLIGLGKSMGRGMAGAGLGFGAAGGALVATSTEAILEAERASKVSGVGLQRIQEMGYAARTVGIEVEDLGDKLKDVNDKFADAIEGVKFDDKAAGPLVDFVERILPQIGVSLDEFEKMNSAERLQAFVNGLEAAGISNVEGATFYLEGIASDSTKLFELLQNNGAELERLAQAKRDSGTTFTAEDVENAKAMQQAMMRMKDATDSLGAALAEAGVADAVETMAQWFETLASYLREEINPGALKWATIFAAAAAALVPIVLTIGFIAAGVIAIGAPVAGIVAGFVALYAILTAAYLKFEAFRNVADGIAGHFRGMFSGLKESFDNMLKDPIRGILPFLLDVLTTAFSLTPVGMLYDAMVGAFKRVGDWLGGWFGEAFAGLGEALLSGPFGAIKAILDAGGKIGGKIGDFLGFRSGGYTGNGGEGQAAGIVHGKEYVLNAAATRHFGRDALDKMNNMLMPPAFAMPAPALAGGGASRRVAVDIRDNGQTFSVEADEATAELLERHYNRKAATRSTRRPRSMR